MSEDFVSFEDLKLPRQYLNALEDLDFHIPTPIQLKAIPVIRSGQHIIGIAQTGTGKTAAYLLPIMQNLSYAQGTAVRCIILVPTKELVLQVLEHVLMLSKYTDLRAVGLYGGVGRKRQAADIEAGVDIVVSTPMRLLELYTEEGMELKRTEILVLDEADRMLDMGFHRQLNTILDVLPRKKQNMMFSATFSPEVEELSWNFMDFPVKLEITPEATPVETVEQRLYHIPNVQSKLNLLVELLKDIDEMHRVMIFVKSKHSANRIFDFLQKHEVSGEMRLIHSNKGQNTRINSFNDFKEGEVRLLICTDVMARGIDVSEVSHVVNFDVPKVYEDYVHRIGRTGRAWNSGIAITFVTKSDVYHVGKIEKKIRMPIPVHQVPETVEIVETPFEENQDMEKEIDAQKKKDDPNYQGAFHEKKNFKLKQKIKQSKKTPKFTGKSKSMNMKSNTSGKRKTSKHNRKKK